VIGDTENAQSGISENVNLDRHNIFLVVDWLSYHLTVDHSHEKDFAFHLFSNCILFLHEV
jgi:hypothetical protein